MPQLMPGRPNSRRCFVQKDSDYSTIGAGHRNWRLPRRIEQTN